eukprot:352026-Chlamydomonas_euryale.AAC.6
MAALHKPMTMQCNPSSELCVPLRPLSTPPLPPPFLLPTHPQHQTHAHHDDVHDQADQQVRQVELKLLPEVVAALAHFRDSGATCRHQGGWKRGRCVEVWRGGVGRRRLGTLEPVRSCSIGVETSSRISQDTHHSI